MTSRERVMCAINHQEADRVPIDCGSMRSSGLTAIAFNKLKRELDFETPCLLYDFVQQLAYPQDVIRKRFHVDAIDVGEAFIGDIHKDWRPWDLHDGSSCYVPRYIDARIDPKDQTIYLYDKDGFKVGKQPATSYYVDQIYFPYGDLEEIPEEMDENDWGHTLWDVPVMPFHLDFVNSESDYQKFVKTIKDFRKNTDCATMILIGNSFLEFGGYIRTPVKFLMDIYEDREGTERLLDALEERYMSRIERILQDVAEDIDIIQFGDDLGTQRGPWMNPEVIREIFGPHYRRMWDYVHSKGCKVFMHCCGSIASVLPILIDCGVDIINPVQTTAANMDPIMLKREFGKDVCFWGGGCEPQGVLTTGTPEEVRDQVKRRLEIFGKGGGFVFNQIHNVLPNVPVENILAMYDTAYEFSSYN